MLKLLCKTTFTKKKCNSALVGQNFIKIKQELTLEECFEKNVVLYKIFSKKFVTEYFLHVSVHLLNLIIITDKIPYLKIHIDKSIIK